MELKAKYGFMGMGGIYTGPLRWNRILSKGFTMTTERSSLLQIDVHDLKQHLSMNGICHPTNSRGKEILSEITAEEDIYAVYSEDEVIGYVIGITTIDRMLGHIISEIDADKNVIDIREFTWLNGKTHIRREL